MVIHDNWSFLNQHIPWLQKCQKSILFHAIICKTMHLTLTILRETIKSEMFLMKCIWSCLGFVYFSTLGKFYLILGCSMLIIRSSVRWAYCPAGEQCKFWRGIVNGRQSGSRPVGTMCRWCCDHGRHPPHSWGRNLTHPGFKFRGSGSEK